MSNGRKKYLLSDMDEIRKAFNLPKGKSKQKKSYDEQRRKAQRIKFCKCPTCGGMMTFVPFTNTLICENEVKKKIKKKSKEGVESEVEVIAPCGEVNIVGDEFISYINYLFDGVPANQAVTDFKNKKVNKEKEEDK